MKTYHYGTHHDSDYDDDYDNYNTPKTNKGYRGNIFNTLIS